MVKVIFKKNKEKSTPYSLAIFLVDPDLVHRLEEEMQFEESDEKNEVPAFVKEFLDSNLFKVKKTQHKVHLERNKVTDNRSLD